MLFLYVSASAVGIMGIVGNFLSPILMTRFGRQKTHLITTVPAILGWIVFLLANSVPLFLLARILHGLALGLRTPLAAILVAEYTDPKYRGSFLGTFAISLGLGILLSHLWGSLLTWKMTSLACGMFPIIALFIISLSPESPCWLVSKGRYDEAKKSFIWLRGSGVVQLRELDQMINAHKSEMILEKKDNGEVRNIVNRFTLIDLLKSFIATVKKVSKIFKKKAFFKPALVAISILIIFEFGGAHIFPAYGNLILQSVLGKASANDVNWQLTIMDFLRTISAFVAIFLLKYLQRRTILFTSGIMTVLSMVSISIFIYLRTSYSFSNPMLTETLPMCLMIAYIASFCLGLVPLTWVICGEVFPLAYRSLGSTISTAMLTPSFVLSMKTAPHLFTSVGVEGAFLLYAATLTVCLVIIYSLLPETKDKTLQEIELSFRGKTIRDSEVGRSLMDKDDVEHL